MFLYFQKYPAQTGDGNDSQDEGQQFQKDVPISGESNPILADSNYNSQYYVTPRPVYNDQYYTTPKYQRPHRNTKLKFQSDPNYYTTPKPLKFTTSNYYDQSDYNQQYYTTRRPNRGFAFTNDYQNNNNNNKIKNYEETTSSPVIYATPYAPHAENQLPNVYTTPNRVLYASSSRPYKTSRQVKQLKFPSNLNDIKTSNSNSSPLKFSLNFPTNKYLTRDTISMHGVLFPDRTGTGELRLDTAVLEQGTRSGKSLRFPRHETSSPSTSSQPEKTSDDKQISFPNP